MYNEMSREIQGGLMLGSIIFFSLFFGAVFIMMTIYDRVRGGHSAAYYKYLENNKVPPPEERDTADILISSLWGKKRR